MDPTDENCYIYYSTQRPVDIGTTPRPPDGFANFDERKPVEKGAYLAWGIVIYSEALTEKEMRDYELRPSRHNPDVKDRMALQAQAVGTWEVRNHISEDKRLTRWDNAAGAYIPLDNTTVEQLQRQFELAMDFPAISAHAPRRRKNRLPRRDGR